MSQHRTRRRVRDEKPREPLLLWWMPLLALAGPVIYAAWTAASAQNLTDVAFSLVWPGLALYAATLAVLWAGWKIDLE
jgi:hypothetical protein